MNEVGTGLPSNVASATPLGASGAVSNLTAASEDGQVTLSWSAPQSDGGAPVIRYEYQVGDGSWVSTGGTDTDFVVGGLTNGTPYTFRVRAVNEVGTGLPSNVASATPLGASGAVSNLTAASGDGQVTLSWSAPQSDGACR